MFNTFLFIHIVISVLLVAVILLQKTSANGLSGLGGGYNNMGLVSGQSVTNFLTKLTIILGGLFFISSLLLANLSAKTTHKAIKKIESVGVQDNQKPEATKEDTLPVAK